MRGPWTGTSPMKSANSEDLEYDISWWENAKHRYGNIHRMCEGKIKKLKTALKKCATIDTSTNERKENDLPATN